jgi:hypothetical protein
MALRLLYFMEVQKCFEDLKREGPVKLIFISIPVKYKKKAS